MSCWVVLATVVSMSFWAMAEVLVPYDKAYDFEAGADFRFRYECKDNWMDKGKTSVSPKYEDYYRMRTRVWGHATAGEDWGAYLRVGNEFRGYRNAESNKDRNQFPDEWFIDNLYFDAANIGDRVNLRIGRQDVKEGAGRVISDGTAGDGSRSTYFDAIFAKVRLLKESTVDLMGTWARDHDEWTLGNPHDVYDLTKIRSGDPYSKMTEKGLMAYFHLREIPNFPLELYWIWKGESRFHDESTRYPGRDFHTLGTRLLPGFNDKLSGEVEAAAQVGNIDGQPGMEARDILAFMGYAGLSYSDKSVAGKPKLTGAILYLSGDEDSFFKTKDGGTDNGWNPVFNRTTWLSEICANMYDQNRWSNLIYPHIETAVEPHKKHTVKLQTGPMFAATKDSGAADPCRGYFTQFRYDFPLLSRGLGERGALTGSVVGETLVYGDYYRHHTATVDEPVACWLRFEVNGRF